MEISEAPKPSATSESMTRGQPECAERPDEHPVVDRDAKQGETATSIPVMAPDLKAMSRPAARLLEVACAVRTLARTETCMP